MPDDVRQVIADALEQGMGESRILLLKIPDDTYFDTVLDALSIPLNRGFSGVYVSFQRPYSNLIDRFEEEDMDLSQLLFVDLTESITGMDAKQQDEAVRCEFLKPDAPIDAITRTIYHQLKALDVAHRFVFIDSLSTITIHRPLSETLQLVEFLHKRLEHLDLENIILVFSVAQGLHKEDFLRDIALEEDEVMEVTL